MSHTVSARSRDDAQQKRMEVLVERHLRGLFDRLPTLAGFRLRDDLMVADLSTFSWPASAVNRGLDEIVMRSLVELAECHPEAVALMRGRTFARSLH